jgi:hypothetical protein
MRLGSIGFVHHIVDLHRSYGQVAGVNTSLVEVRNNRDKEKYNEAMRRERRAKQVRSGVRSPVSICSNIDLQTILIR